MIANICTFLLNSALEFALVMERSMLTHSAVWPIRKLLQIPACGPHWSKYIGAVSNNIIVVTTWLFLAVMMNGLTTSFCIRYMAHCVLVQSLTELRTLPAQLTMNITANIRDVLLCFMMPHRRAQMRLNFCDCGSSARGVAPMFHQRCQAVRGCRSGLIGSLASAASYRSVTLAARIGRRPQRRRSCC